MAVKGSNLILFGLAFFLVLTDYSYAETDTLLQGQELKDGGQLVSAFGTFTLGFSRCQYGGSSYYLGIWYSNTNEEDWDHPYRWNYPYREITRHDNKRWVWIANRNRPLDHKYKLLSIGADGNLKIFHSGDPILLTSVQVSVNNTRATLGEDGNLVLSELNEDGSVKQLLWQSFDYPTDTLLPGMKIGINHRTGHNWSLTSGSFTFGMDPNETRQLMIWWGGVLYWRSGVWIDGRFNFSNELSSKFHFQYFSNEFEKYFTYDVNQDGLPLSFPAISISSYGSLGEFTGSWISCDKKSAGCVPDPSCRKNPPIDYGYYVGPHDGFRINASKDLNSMDCRMLCLTNCSCVGYTFEEGINSCRILSKEPFSNEPLSQVIFKKFTSFI